MYASTKLENVDGDFPIWHDNTEWTAIPLSGFFKFFHGPTDASNGRINQPLPTLGPILGRMEWMRSFNINTRLL
jgi:hypothetical protein